MSPENNNEQEVTGQLDNERESSAIELPDDIETIKKMRDKLKIYRERLEANKTQMMWQAPEVIFNASAGTNYKIALVEKLLLEGNVKTHELSQELTEKDGQFDDESFENACNVINDYIKTGGKNTRGGSGF